MNLKNKSNSKKIISEVNKNRSQNRAEVVWACSGIPVPSPCHPYKHLFKQNIINIIIKIISKIKFITNFIITYYSFVISSIYA